MNAWARARRLPLWLGVVIGIGVLADLFGRSALPIVNVDGTAVPMVAIVPALSASVITSSLEPPLPGLHASFPRTTRLLDGLWLLIGAAVTFLLMLPVASTDLSPFTPGDLLRNVAIFTAAAAVAGALAGVRLCWLLPAIVVIAAFVPSASVGRYWWALPVWTGDSIGAAWPSLIAAAACSAALVAAGSKPAASRILTAMRSRRNHDNR